MHLASNAFLDDISLLFNFYMDSENPYILCLIGLPHLLDRLRLMQFQPLEQRIVIRHRHRALLPEEVAPYIEHHLMLAGNSAPLFTPSAIEAIAAKSSCLPRVINNIATHALIFRILTNEQYTGTYIAGKRESSRIGSKKMIEKDRSEWFIFPNRYPPIVSKEDFERVQEILKAPKEALSIGRERSAYAKKLYDRIESGEKKPNSMLYGYRVSPCGISYEVDDTAAQAVKVIFDLALQGTTARDITEELFKAKHIPPGEYFKLARGVNIQPTYRWPTCVCVKS